MVSRVLVSDRLAEQGLEVLRREAGITADVRVGLTPEELRAAIAPYHALVVRSGTRVTAEVIAAAANLRVIGRAGIGVDNIDVDAATRRGVVVMNTPGGNNVTTAEHAITLLLALARNIPQAVASVKAGRWERGRFMGTEVCNKTLGIVGLGNIGSIVAERARGLRMRVVAFDPFVTTEAAAKLGAELVSLDELFARSDFVSLHTPLTAETRGSIDARAIAKMKRGVRVVNCARGEIVVEEDLAAAIRAGHVAGAALDVFAQEPPAADNPLVGLEQVVCTPHLGAQTDEAQLNVAVAVAEQVVAFLRRGVVQNAVNMPSLPPELLAVLRPYLRLAEKLGSLATQIAGDHPHGVQIEYGGVVTEQDTAPLTAAVLRGLLAPFFDSPVNYVNAPHLARERGVQVVESRTSQPTGFVNSIRVRVRTAAGETEVEGTVFSDDTSRIVNINGFRLEAVPEGYILMLHNRDVPGVVGSVGTLLGASHVNIARLELGRERVGGMAVSLIHVDDPVPQAVLEQLRSLPNILSAQLIRL
jgi:D-3-phosphoglycerate dehydrogenase